MITSRILSSLVMFCAITQCNCVLAEFVLRFGNLNGDPIEAIAGQTFLVPVYGSASSGTINSISDFSIGVDIGDSGTSVYFGSGETVRNTTNDLFLTGPSGLGIKFETTAAENADVDFFLFGAFRVDTDFSGPVKLFDLQFTAPLVGTTGFYSINPLVDAGVSYYNVSGNDFNEFTATSLIGGQVSYVITAVPEPSSLMLALWGSSLLMMRRRNSLKN